MGTSNEGRKTAACSRPASKAAWQMGPRASPPSATISPAPSPSSRRRKSSTSTQHITREESRARASGRRRWAHSTGSSAFRTTSGSSGTESTVRSRADLVSIYIQSFSLFLFQRLLRFLFSIHWLGRQQLLWYSDYLLHFLASCILTLHDKVSE